MNNITLQDVGNMKDVFLGKSIGIYGASGSQKTTTAKTILALIQKDIKIPMLFFGSKDSVNSDFDNVVPNMLKFDNIEENIRKIFNTWERQGKICGYYKNINDRNFLKKILYKTEDPIIVNKLNELEHDYKKGMELYVNSEDVPFNKVERNKARLNKIHTVILKNMIIQYRNLIISKSEKYTKEELDTVTSYFNINPNFLIIYDDVTSELNFLSKKASDFFNQGRWKKFTILYTSHGWTSAVSPNVRKGTHVLVFCQETIAKEALADMKVPHNKINTLVKQCFGEKDNKGNPICKKLVVYGSDKDRYGFIIPNPKIVVERIGDHRLYEIDKKLTEAQQ